MGETRCGIGAPACGCQGAGAAHSRAEVPQHRHLTFCRLGNAVSICLQFCKELRSSSAGSCRHIHKHLAPDVGAGWRRAEMGLIDFKRSDCRPTVTW